MKLPAPRLVAGVIAGAVVLSVLMASLVTNGVSASSRQPGSGSVPTTSAALSSIDLVCPVPATTKGLSQATVSAAAAGHGTGTLSLYRLGGPLTGAPLAQVGSGASTLHYAVPPGKAEALVLHATGAYAPGLTASVSIRVASGPGRSLQSVPCSAPAGDAWFVGGGASVGRSSVLLLTNIDAAPATVDVAIYTSSGMQQPFPVQGVTVQPRSQLSFALDVLVPGAVATALHVSTRSGRVASALSDSQVNGLVSQGADWVPATSGPTQGSVLSGIPGATDAQSTLSLVIPGPDDAVVNVHLVTAQGTLSPGDLQGLSAPSGKLTTVVIPAAETGGGPFAVVVLSDRAAVAGVRTVRTVAGAGNLPEFSYSAAATAAQHSVRLSSIAHTAAVSTLLQLTVLGANDVVVSLTTSTTGSGAKAPTAVVTVRITVAAGTSVQVPLGPVGAGLSTVLVETASGAAALYLGVVVVEAAARGPLITGGPVPATPLTLQLPAVAADPAAGYPGH